MASYAPKLFAPTPAKKPQIKKETPVIAGLQLAALTTHTDTTATMPTRTPQIKKPAVEKAPVIAPSKTPVKPAAKQEKRIARTIQMPKESDLSWRKSPARESFEVAQNFTYSLE